MLPGERGFATFGAVAKPLSVRCSRVNDMPMLLACSRETLYLPRFRAHDFLKKLHKKEELSVFPGEEKTSQQGLSKGERDSQTD